MPIVVFKVILACGLLAAMLFAAFGFLATFEPVAGQWAWRSLYIVLGLGSVAGLVLIAGSVLKGLRARSSGGCPPRRGPDGAKHS